MSTSGSAANSRSAPSAVATSAATPPISAPGSSPRSSSTTASTRAASRPLTTACAPHAASRATIARPMPCVDPLTKAVRPLRSMSMVRGYAAAATYPCLRASASASSALLMLDRPRTPARFARS